VRIGIISDAHGNGPGLDLVLSFLEKQGVDRLLFLGDAIGYGPCNREVCERLELAGADCLMGNHEAMLLGLEPMPEWAVDIVRLPESWDELPRGWGDMVRANGLDKTVELGGRKIFCTHGVPGEPFTCYVNADQAADVDFDGEVMLMGHTHRPYVVRHQGRLIINPGSCGVPRDYGHLLSLAILDPEAMDAQVYRLPFTPPENLLKRVHPRVARCFERTAEDVFGEIWGGQ
jgi:putative phosphoesterase